MQETVLIVDDDVGVRDTARLVLAREGYEVLTASDGRSAIEVMAKDGGGVCTVLCDLEMPGGGGRALIRHVRQYFPDTTILVLSGAQDTVFLDGIVEEGVGDWLRKPVTREELVSKVRTAVNLCMLRRKDK